MAKILYVIILLYCSISCNGMIQELQVPRSLEECFERYASKTTVGDTVGESIQWFCVNQYVWIESKEKQWLNYNMTSEGYTWLKSLLEPERNRNKRAGIRVRREYRSMKDEDRHKFHRAIQMLKADTSVLPNRYDVIASFHESDMMTTAAHGGPNFLGWHRMYLLMFENALREKVPDVTIPYWDSTLDAKMRNPAQSIIWSELFMGNGDGLVKTGPFAHWQTKSGPLTRNVGMTGQPIQKHIIQNIMKMSFVGEITEPHALPENNLEFHHSECHLHVDGNMGALATSSQDPVFFLHHAYVDHVWEVFRQKQRVMGIDPTKDYPMVVNNTMHHAEAPMGFRNMKNIDSYKNEMIEGIYTYEPVPTCKVNEQHCSSPYIRCVTMGTQAECVSVERPLWFRRPNVNVQNGNPKSQTPGRIHMNSGVEQIPMMPATNVANNRNLSITVDVRRIPVSKFGVAGKEETFLQMPRPSLPNGNPDWLSQTPGNMSPEDMMNMRKSANVFAGMQHARPGWLSSQAFRNSMVESMVSNGGQTGMNAGQPFNKPNVQQSMPGMSNEQGPDSRRRVISMGNPINRPFQNTFTINGRSDSRLWAYIPVTIFYKRPPNFTGYQAFPIMNGKPVMKQDVLSSSAFKNLQNQLKSGNPASYMNCRSGQQSAGAVFVHSNGINYMGQYKEYAVVDHRMPISVSTVFVGVKNPQRGATDVMMSAYDSCGRVCRPYCRMSGPQGEVSRPCTGVMRITSDFPKLYGENFGEAIMGAWNFGNEKNCPGLNVNNVYLSFYCNYEEAWPFPGKVKPQMQTFGQSEMQPKQIPKPIPQPMPVTPQMKQMPQQIMIQQMKMQQRLRQIQMMRQQQIQQQQQMQQQNQVLQQGRQEQQQRQMMQTPSMRFMPFAVCNVGSGCVIRRPCGVCTAREMIKCERTCSMYGRCFGGKFHVQRCREGGMFNRQLGRCVPGTCPEEEQSPFVATKGTSGQSASDGD